MTPFVVGAVVGDLLMFTVLHRLAGRHESLPPRMRVTGCAMLAALVLTDVLRFTGAHWTAVLAAGVLATTCIVTATAASFRAWIEYTCETWLLSGCITLLGVFTVIIGHGIPRLDAVDGDVVLVSLALFTALAVERSMRSYTGGELARRLLQAYAWVRLLAWVLAAAVSCSMPGMTPLPARVAAVLAYLCGFAFVVADQHRPAVEPGIIRSEVAPTLALVLAGLVLAVEIVAFVAVPGMARWSVLVLTAGSAAALLCRQVLTNRRLVATVRTAREQERYFRSLVQDSTDVIAICDDDGLLEYVSPAATTVLQGPGLPVPLGTHAATLIGCSSSALGAAVQECTRTGEARVEGHRGAQVLETSLARREDRFVLSVRDVTERDRMRARLHALAYTDSLTGLANRHRLLLDVDALQRTPGRSCVHALFVDLDRFKHINDASGHRAGDDVLRQVAARLRECVPASALLARLGGDEFVVVLRDDEANAERVATAINRAVSRPFTVDAQVYQIGASVGIASSEPGLDADGLLQRADLAMYEAKQAHRPWVRYVPSMSEHVRHQAALDHELAQEWGRDAVGVHLQPIVSTSTLQVHSTEALLRWRHPDGTVSGPMDALGFAQRTGRLATLTGWIVERVLAEVSASPSTSTPIAVNMPPSVLAETDFVAGLASRIALLGILPTRITLEIPEDAVVEQGTAGLRALRALHDEGFHLHIDDFGTGFSSLAYLLRLPVDGLKIDRSFTRELNGSEAARSVVLGLVSLSRELGIELIAEGVETPAEHEALVRLGVPYAQGFWYARPEDMTTINDRFVLAGWATGRRAPLPAVSATSGIIEA